MKKRFCLFFLLFFSSFAKGISFGGPGIDNGYKVIRTLDRGYALLGQYDSAGKDIYLIKLDSLVHFQWSKRYGNPGEDEYANDIVQTLDGGYLIMGTHMNSLSLLRAWLIRLNNTGDTIWTQTYEDDPHYSDEGSFVEVYNANKYTIGINSVGLSASNYLFLYRTDTLGNAMDTISTSTEYGKVLPLSDGYIMTATNNSIFPGDINLHRIDTAGQLLFNKDFYDPNFTLALNGNSTAICHNGFLTVGSTNLYTSNPGNFEFYIMRTDSSGDSLWTKHWGSDISSLNFILRNNFNSYYVAGYVQDTTGHRNDYILKMDSLGDTLWTKFAGNNLSISSMIMINAGMFAVVGDTIDPVNGNTDVWFSLYDSLGNKVNNPSTGFLNYPSNEEKTIKAYPNPARDHINVDCGMNYPDYNGYNLKVENALGITLFSRSINERYYSINLNSWHAGEIYFLDITNKSGRIVEVKRIVKE